MFTLSEKKYMLSVLKKEKALGWLRLKPPSQEHSKLIEKLEQMIRNEEVNKEHL